MNAFCAKKLIKFSTRTFNQGTTRNIGQIFATDVAEQRLNTSFSNPYYFFEDKRFSGKQEDQKNYYFKNC